ncbi:DUF2971 domain-containing protein, partial [Vibrio parahaemolyticus]
KGDDAWLEFKRKQLKVFEKAHKKTVSNLINNYKWCCFSEPSEKNLSPMSNRLMWSHYANGLRGFVIEFEKEALIDSLDHYHG